MTGSITDEQKVEDVYVFVSNQQSKIESRKVFYRSNRSGKDPKTMAFTSDLPLWPGSNMITVVARANTGEVGQDDVRVPRHAADGPGDDAGGGGGDDHAGASGGAPGGR